MQCRDCHANAKFIISALLLFVLPAVFLGCGSSSSSASSGAPGSSASPASPNPIVQSAAPKFVYALNGSAGANSAVAGFQINASTGVLTPIAGSPFSIGPIGPTTVSVMGATPLAAFVYVVDWLTKQVIVMRADPNSGALSQLFNVPVASLQNPTDARVDPSGKFLFIADPGASDILSFTIASDGSLTPATGAPFPTAQPMGILTIDAASHFLFAAGGNMVTGFTIGSNGTLTPTTGSPVTVRAPFITPGKGPIGLTPVLDPSSRFLYAVDQTFPRVFVFSVGGDGLLTAVAGSPFTTDICGVAANVNPSGNFLYVGGFGDASVSGLSVNTTTGVVSIVPGSPFPNGTGGAPIANLVVDPSGKFVLTANEEETNISVFSINQTTGALTMVSGSPFPTAASPIGGGSPSVVVVTR